MVSDFKPWRGLVWLAWARFVRECLHCLILVGVVLGLYLWLSDLFAPDEPPKVKVPIQVKETPPRPARPPATTPNQ